MPGLGLCASSGAPSGAGWFGTPGFEAAASKVALPTAFDPPTQAAGPTHYSREVSSPSSTASARTLRAFHPQPPQVGWDGTVDSMDATPELDVLDKTPAAGGERRPGGATARCPGLLRLVTPGIWLRCVLGTSR